MGRVMMYITIMLTISALAPLFGVETTSMMLIEMVVDRTTDGIHFVLDSFSDRPFWTSIIALLGISTGAVFVGTIFKIPMELIALIPLTILLFSAAGDLWTINTKMEILCPGISSQIGCFMEPIVSWISALLFMGYAFTLISWWAGRNA